MSKGYILDKLTGENLSKVFRQELIDDFNLIDALDKGFLLDLGLNYGIIYNFDSVLSERIGDIVIDVDNIIEARFFNEDKEIRIFRNEDQIDGTIFVEKDNPDYLEKRVLLYPRDRSLEYANKLDVRKYIDYDQDNQAYIRYTRPTKLHFTEVIE